ncbi:unnamed protein product [Rhizoctonia solani]|uniref:Uncharacterized protein n=1 Tax=Rhizoctonia solani TaxID=456999 RepID=A0A8H3BW72_9AGAM|nr:unnamed protein product [Rhizoctonia solani]
MLPSNVSATTFGGSIAAAADGATSSPATATAHAIGDSGHAFASTDTAPSAACCSSSSNDASIVTKEAFVSLTPFIQSKLLSPFAYNFTYWGTPLNLLWLDG